MDHRVVYLTSHAPVEQGHGGNRRVMQLIRVLETATGELPHVVHLQFGGSVGRNVRDVIRGLFSVGPISRLLSLRGIRNWGASARVIKEVELERGDVIVLDAHIRVFSPMLAPLRNKGIRVIFAPHNLDSLTPQYPDPVNGRQSPGWIEQELKCFAAADLVLTISREEQWLLSAYGIEAVYLPYQLTEQDRRFFDEVRARRATSEKDLVLILGTARNVPTFEGIALLLNHGVELVAAASPRTLVVAGYGTELLRAKAQLRGVEIRGGVDSAELLDLLSRAAVCLVYQRGTSGALTRIREMLYSDIPVICNPIAARSYFDEDGILVAEDIYEMISKLRSFDRMKPLSERHARDLVTARIRGLLD